MRGLQFSLLAMRRHQRSRRIYPLQKSPIRKDGPCPWCRPAKPAVPIGRWCEIRLEDGLSQPKCTTGERPGVWHSCCGTQIRRTQIRPMRYSESQRILTRVACCRGQSSWTRGTSRTRGETVRWKCRAVGWCIVGFPRTYTWTLRKPTSEKMQRRGAIGWSHRQVVGSQTRRPSRMG